MRLRLTATAFLILLVSAAQAMEFIATTNYTVAADESKAGEQWVTANVIKAEGTFQNDLFAGSGTDLLLSGTYQGNLWGIAGADASMSGSCERNVRLAAPTIRINGSIDGNLLAMANTILIATNAAIHGDVWLLGNQVIMEGAINGSLTLDAKRTATISGTIEGNAKASSPEIILPEEARIRGALSYTTDRELLPGENVVGGKLERIMAESLYSTARIRKQAMALLAAWLTAIPFISLFPMTTAMASLLARKSPFRCFLVGFIAMGALPFLGIICLSTMIGFPLGSVILASWGILIYTSRIIMGLMIGTLILKTGNTSAGRILLATILGLTLIYVFTFIPSLIGGLVQFTVIWIGMGSLLLALIQKRRLIIQVPDELRQMEALKKEQNKSTEEM